MPRTASSAAASLSSRRSTSRKSGSHETHRWRKPDSNHRSRSYDRVSTVAEGRYRTDKPDGVIFARRRRLAADPPLSTAVSFTGGTDGSNPASSSGESDAGLGGVKSAFVELASPEQHAKVMVEPWS